MSRWSMQGLAARRHSYRWGNHPDDIVPAPRPSSARRGGVVAALVAAVMIAVGLVAPAVDAPPAGAVGESTTFDVPGTYTYTVPSGMNQLTVDALGGAGGRSRLSGGLGGRVRTVLPVTPGDVLTVIVGGGSQYSWGGYGGGPGNGDGGNSDTYWGRGGGGGGASTVSLDYTRLLVAGGGGGDGNNFELCGGYGGGAATPDGGDGCAMTGGASGQGGTSTEGGAAGCDWSNAGAVSGATGPDGGEGSFGGGGGGGGGYYGGGGGCTPAGYGGYGGGGGGSSFVTPAAISEPIFTVAPSTDVDEYGGLTGNGFVTLTPGTQVSPVPVALTLDPAAQDRSIGSTATVTATVRDSGGNLAAGVPVGFTRSGANPASAQTVVTNATGQAVYSYGGGNEGTDTIQANVAGSPTAVGAATVTWTRDRAYSSNDCSPAGTAVFDGFVGPDYVKLRTQQVGGATWVCLAVDDGVTHFGGKVKVGGGLVPGNVTVNDGVVAADRCDANPSSRIVNQSGFVTVVNYDIDVNTNPNSTDAAWICVVVSDSVTNTPWVAKQIVISTSTPSDTGFDQDLVAPYPFYFAAPNPGAVSAYCQANGGTRLVNADVGPGHVWLYTLSEAGGTRQHVCFRGRNGTTVGGERLTVDGGGGQNLVSVTQQDVAPSVFGTYCTIPVFGSDDPYVFLKAGVASPSAYGCVGVLGTNKLLTVTANPGGGQTVVTHQEETT